MSLKKNWNKAMKEDPIVEEVRQYREQHAAQLNYDLQSICQYLKEQEQGSEQIFSSYSPRILGTEKDGHHFVNLNISIAR
jgi:hypothetical protein